MLLLLAEVCLWWFVIVVFSALIFAGMVRWSSEENDEDC